MNIMLKRITIILLFSFLFVLAGCGKSDAEREQLEIKAQEIVRCFDEKNYKSLKILFSERTLLDAPNIDEQIQRAFDAYEGESTSYRFSYLGMDGSQVDGVWTDQHTIVKINSLKTDGQKTYVISYTDYLVYNDDKRVVGIIGMSLRDENNNVLAVIG